MLKPFVKWAGGKRQLLTHLVSIVENHFSKYDTYIEPFVGGGSLFFKLLPKNFIINDQNKELVELYNVIKNNSEELISLLEEYQLKHNEEYFYQIRDYDRHATYSLENNINKSARFIYLNKTCFNGLYRVNSKGHFNVPFGKYKNPKIINKDNIEAVAKFLNQSNGKILNSDFEFVIKHAKKNDLVYFDPPYIPLENSNSFISYTKEGFTFDDQIRLRDCAIKLIRNGVNVILSNSYTKKTLEIYNLGDDNSMFDYIIVEANRNINSKASGRKGVKEVIIWNKKGVS